ncbi:hypothetical protein L1887_07647 [Cichorium endivia]|nr:hypothetical protein L1887_07647 [Cichorium endivia]
MENNRSEVGDGDSSEEEKFDDMESNSSSFVEESEFMHGDCTGAGRDVIGDDEVPEINRTNGGDVSGGQSVMDGRDREEGEKAKTVGMVSSPDKGSRIIEDSGKISSSMNLENGGFEEQDEDQLIGGPMDHNSPCSVENIIRSDEIAGPCSIPDINSPIPCSEPIKRGQNYVKWNGRKARMSVKFKYIIKASNNRKRKSKKAQNCNVSQKDSTFSNHSKTSV